MLDLLKELLSRQYEAAFRTLSVCIDRCPGSAWAAPVANLAFCQVAFHTLFFADFYLGEDDEAFRQQPFHRHHQGFFRDYEELLTRRQQLHYERSAINTYLAHCRRKASEVIAAATAKSLHAHAGFCGLEFSRAELHVYNIRHIQHHSAQLILRLRLDGEQGVPWVKSGWM